MLPPVVSTGLDWATGKRSVSDTTPVPCCSRRYPSFLSSPVELVKIHAGVDRIDLQVKGRRLSGLLLLTREASETVGKGFGDEENHLLFRF